MDLFVLITMEKLNIFCKSSFRKKGIAKKLLKLTKEKLGKDLIPQKPISPLGKNYLI